MTESFAFGPFVLMPERNVLLTEGTPVKIGSRALDILVLLVRRRGALVSKSELIAHAWPGRVVGEDNLKVNIAALRRALGDDAGEARYVTTVAGQGYRFIETVVDHAAKVVVPHLTRSRAPRSFGFGPFVLIPERQLLLADGDGVEVPVGGRALEILKVLVSRSGELITKRELMERVWPNTVVVESNLKANLASLRRALGDGAGESRYIATVTGRGYRFIETVRLSDDEPLSLAANRPAAPRQSLLHGRAPLFGRGAVIDTALCELAASRLVSVVGTGGVGKTALALCVAERLVDAFADGVWLVDLSWVDDAERVLDAIATAFVAGTPREDALAAVCDFVRQREMLLVLDTCEHVKDCVAECAERLLAVAPGLKLLATSRERLGLRGERVLSLAGLSTPPSDASLSAHQALTYPAVQLFAERAGDSLQGYRLGDDDVAAVVAICRRLDGLPLAIELVATRVEAFGLDDLLRRSDGFLALLARRGGPGRHRTLAAALDWSYRLLAQSESAVLRAVSAFAGAFDAEGAAAVAGIGVATCVRVLTTLVDKSLLDIDTGAKGQVYRVLETTRAYCLERLHASGEYADVRGRHAAHVCELLEPTRAASVALAAH